MSKKEIITIKIEKKQKVPIAEVHEQTNTGAGKVSYKTTKCFDHTQEYINKLSKDEITKLIQNANIDCNSGKFPTFTQKCCKDTTQKGGYINLTKEQATELIKQIGGNSIKSTYITYNENNAKILGYNKQTQNLIIQTNTGLENVSVNNLLVNGKSVI